MRTKMAIPCVLFLAAFLGSAAFAAEEGKLKVLIVTGGHGFNREAFFTMFQDNPEIACTKAEQVKASEAYDRHDLLAFDVVLLYDMVQNITEAQKARFLSLFDKGTGLVVLHHALVSYQKWAEFERIIGGRYPEPEDRKGVVTPEVGYEHDLDIPVKIVARDHPVTAGLNDFVLHDEIYWGFRVGSDVTPLLATTNPKSGNPLAWARTEKNSRVVFVQPGHGPEAFEDSNYRRLLAQGIRWAANKGEGGGWVSLFDGRTLDGWVQRGGKAKYRVADGQIVGKSVPDTPNSFLCTTRDYTNFVLELEFKVDAGLNSGIQIRSHCFDQPTESEWNGRKIKVPSGRVHGLQVEIDPSSRAWTGGVYEEGARGWLNDLKNNEAARNAFRANSWNKFRIECRSESIKTWLNEIPAADLKDSRVASGFIALQVHGVGSNERILEVRFRNLRLKEL
jgi:type 1 glutamine amidotransferase